MHSWMNGPLGVVRQEDKLQFESLKPAAELRGLGASGRKSRRAGRQAGRSKLASRHYYFFACRVANYISRWLELRAQMIHSNRMYTNIKLITCKSARYWQRGRWLLLLHRRRGGGGGGGAGGGGRVEGSQANDHVGGGGCSASTFHCQWKKRPSLFAGLVKLRRTG